MRHSPSSFALAVIVLVFSLPCRSDEQLKKVTVKRSALEAGDCLQAAASLEPSGQHTETQTIEILSAAKNPGDTIAKATALGVGPRHSITTNGGTITVGEPFEVSGRLFSFALVRIKDQNFLRLFYRSRSHGAWKAAPATSGRELFKPEMTLGQNAICVPADVELFLNKRIGEAPPLERSVPDALVSGSIANLDWDAYLKLKKDFPVEPVEILSKKSSWMLLDANEVTIADTANSPNYQREAANYTYDSELAGTVKVHAYRSKNGNLNYMIHEELKSGRIWIASITDESAPITAYGTPSRAVRAHELTLPLWERKGSLLEQHHGQGHPTDTNMVSTWPYLKQLPVIRDWYVANNRQMPD